MGDRIDCQQCGRVNFVGIELAPGNVTGKEYKKQNAGIYAQTAEANAQRAVLCSLVSAQISIFHSHCYFSDVSVLFSFVTLRLVGDASNAIAALS